MARARTNHVVSPIFCLLAITIIHLIDYTNCKPYQLLKHKDGYIAVFIRHGDEPLANIDPVLAAAFNEKNIENGVVPIEHQDNYAIDASVIDNEKLREMMLTDTDIKNDQPQAHLAL